MRRTLVFKVHVEGNKDGTSLLLVPAVIESFEHHIRELKADYQGENKKESIVISKNGKRQMKDPRISYEWQTFSQDDAARFSNPRVSDSSREIDIEP